MIEAYTPPVIEEDEPVFIRHAGEVRSEHLREALVRLLSFRLDNDLNHVQFMHGYGLANYRSDDYPDENRALLIEWEKQTRRVKQVASELTDLGAPTQQLISEANYWLDRGRYKHALSATQIDNWNDMLVWRWMRARAHCARSVMEFGSIYVPLSDIAFQAYFDLGLTRWPAASTGLPVERLVKAYRGGGHDEIVQAIRKWYGVAVSYVSAMSGDAQSLVDMRLWTRDPSIALSWFKSVIQADLMTLGLPARVTGIEQG